MLGMVLGSHSDCFYAGEAEKTRFFGDQTKPARKRHCKLCGPGCPVWSDFEVGPSSTLYHSISSKTRKSVVIDSTKSVEWIRWRISEVASSGARPIFLFLQRDGRAVLNSRIRKYPQRGVEEQIRAWIERIEETTALYDSLGIPKKIVRYETFATEPERTTREICEVLGLDYEPEMLAFYEHEQHPLGGNNGAQFIVARQLGRPLVRVGERSREYYEGHAAGIELDLRWKQELEEAHLDLFERVAGRENRPLRWEG